MYALLLHPIAALSLSQGVGITWGVLIFSHWLSLAPMVSRSRVMRIVESAAAGAGDDLWCIDFLAMWLLYTGLILPLTLAVLVGYHVSVSALFCVSLGWLVMSPVLFLQLYLGRLIALVMRQGRVWGLLLVIPWIIPSLLLGLWFFSALWSGGDVISRISVVFGCSMLQGLVLFLAIRRVIRLCYWHCCLRSV